MSFKPKKSLGQHFLTDTNMIFKIADSVDAAPGDRVVEIGPGPGALTEVLAGRFDDLHAIEVDDRAIEILKDKLPGLQLHEQDVLKTEWKALSAGKEQTHVIGNLPYYITSPILFGLLAEREVLADAVLMMQKEVAARLAAEPRTKEYGILSVQTQLMSSVELLFDVPPQVFSPPPKVHSTVVRLRFDRPSLRCSDAHLKTVVRTAFNQRRKKLRNALKPVLGDYVPAQIDLHKRAEALTPGEYEMLTGELEQNGILT